MKKAFYIARTGRPGPVLVDLPKDVQMAQTEFRYPETVDIRGYKPTVEGHPKQIEKVAKPVVLIGGLGMGFTLRAALTVLGSRAKIVVSELVPAVVAWARGPMAEVFGDSLDDVRVKIRETDVGEIIRAQRSAFDAILLDVDNGPEGLTRKGNDALYNASGLKAAKTALRPGGVLAVWSSGPNPAFTKRLGSAGFDVNEVNVRATGRGGAARHVIWMARKN